MDKNNRIEKAAHRRSMVVEEKQNKYDTILQDKENREQKAAEKRKKEIQSIKEKAEAKNQRVQAVHERKKAQESECFECRKCLTSIQGRSFVTFGRSFPCSHHRLHSTPTSRRHSLDNLSAQKLQSLPTSMPPASDSPPKPKSVSNFVQSIEALTSSKKDQSSIKKLARTIRKAAVKTNHFNFSSASSSHHPTVAVMQSNEEMLNQIHQLEKENAKSNEKITHLEEYIDDLLCRIIENCPHLLELDY